MENFYNDSRLKNISPMKLKLIREISMRSKGHSIEEMLPQIMSINKELKKRNLNFTKDESELIMDILTENMSPAERKRFAMLKSMMGF